MKRYCVIGTSDVIMCEDHLKPANSVEVSTTNPNPKLYVISNDGTWIVNPVLSYSEIRQIVIDGEWSYRDQLEAITEYFIDPENGTKLQQLVTFLKETKNKYPK